MGSILDDVVTGLIKYLTGLLKDEAKFLAGVEDSVNSLHAELKLINIFLKNSEGKRNNEMVKELVGQIRDVAYKAEYVIDGYILKVAEHRKMSMKMRIVVDRSYAMMIRDVGSMIVVIIEKMKKIYDLYESKRLIVADLDGKVYSVDTGSRKILWSFESGRPIYSSYQESLSRDNDKSNASESDNDAYIDCGEDWALYAHSKIFGKVKLEQSPEEYIRNAPYVSEDGGVTLGSKKTTVFLVDAKSGKVVHTYKLDDSPSKSGVQGAEENPVLLVEHAEGLVDSDALNLETVEQPLYIKRIDYLLQHYSPDNGKVLWNVAFAKFDAAFRYRKIESSYGGIYHKSSHVLDQEIAGSQLLYQSGPTVVQIHDHWSAESLSLFDRLLDCHSGGRPLSMPAPSHNFSSGADDQLLLAPPNTEGRQMLSFPTTKNKTSGILFVDAIKMEVASILAEILEKFHIMSLISFLLSIMRSIFYRHRAFAEQLKLNKHEDEFKVQAGAPKRKRHRRLRNNKKSANNQEMPKDNAHENNDGKTKGAPNVEGSERKPLVTFTDLVDTCVDGRRIGKLFVSYKEIDKGSNGTIVLEGIYDGRPAAVKRLVRAHHDVALKEIQNFIDSDHHPNIVRWYGVEYDQDFVYIALECCACSLNGLIFKCSEIFQSQIITKDQDSDFLNEYTVRLQSIKEISKDVELWKKNGHPTPQLLKLMRDVVYGLAHLHELGIIHRDLKPQNVLITKQRSLCAKLSDMGISKRLSGDKSSLSQHATGCGSSGWRAPELLLHRRQTRAVDMFSLGCVLFFCATGGKHPYGESFERDVNIVNDRKDLFLVENIPEAFDLFSHLLDPKPDMRPKAMDVWHHPLFWDSRTRLSFLGDVSDWIESKDRKSISELLNALENISNTAPVAINEKWWDKKLDTAFKKHISIDRHRRYNFDSIRDLLRLIRNKFNHYLDLPQKIQKILGPKPVGFDEYFSSRFPGLLIKVYNVICMYCKEKEVFCKYNLI